MTLEISDEMRQEAARITKEVLCDENAKIFY